MSKKHKAYPKYKSSGIDWIGDIPEHWEIKKLKYILYLRSGETPPKNKNKDKKNMNSIKIYGANGVIGYCNEFNLSQKSILIGRVGASGEINITDKKCWVSDNALITIINQRNDFYFVFYLLKSLNLQNFVLKNAMPLITATFVKNMLVMLPPLSEQRTIANYLDRQTSLIDEAIAKQERLISLLEEKRTTIINNATTKGLDPNVKMKPSGIDWIGDIPEHWEVLSLRRIFEIINGSTPKSSNPDFWDGDIFWITPDDLGKLITDTIFNTKAKITIVRTILRH
jgi:type I restriction enzyme, S subunit